MGSPWNTGAAGINKQYFAPLPSSYSLVNSNTATVNVLYGGASTQRQPGDLAHDVYSLVWTNFTLAGSGPPPSSSLSGAVSIQGGVVLH